MLRLLKFLIILSILLAVIGAGVYFGLLYFGGMRIGNFRLPVLQRNARVDLQTVQPLVSQGVSQVAEASKSVPQLQQFGRVLGTNATSASPSTATANNQTPLPQQAFEYARYTYCQQVVKDYEARYSTNTQTSQAQ
jgi:hypothetical protein